MRRSTSRWMAVIATIVVLSLGACGGGGGGSGGGESPAPVAPVVPSAPAVKGWTSAEQLSMGSAKSMLYPEIALFGNGDALAAWMEKYQSSPYYKVVAIHHNPGVGWTNRQELGTCANNTRPTVKVVGSDAYVAWRGKDEQICLRRFLNGGWEDTTYKTSDFGASVNWLGSKPFLHVFPDGKAVVMTQVAENTGTQTWPDARHYAVAFDGNGFGTRTLIGPASGMAYATHLQVAGATFLAADGAPQEGFLVLQRESERRAVPPARQYGSIVTYKLRYGENATVTSERLDTVRSGDDLSSIVLTSSSDGYFTVAWIEAIIEHDSASRVVRSRGPLKAFRLWSGEAIQELSPDADAVYASRTESGSSMLLWVEDKKMKSLVNGVTQEVASADGTVGRLKIASDGSGNRMVLWDETIPGDDDSSLDKGTWTFDENGLITNVDMTTFDDNAHKIRAARYVLGMGWQQPEVVASNGHHDTTGLALVMEGSGIALALWDQRVGGTRWDTSHYYRSVWSEDRALFSSQFK